MNVALVWLALVAASGVVAKQWQAMREPSPGPAASIGSTSLGCLKGAATLPISGPGYEVMRLGRNRRFGHPTLIAFIQRLGATARKKKLGLLLAGDLSQPRGGPTPSGHHSHQTGIDVDLGYAAPAALRAGHLSAHEREHASYVEVVDLKTHKMTAGWTPSVAALLAAAAADPDVDRIFVNPSVKKVMCEDPVFSQQPWQGRLRAWWAHHDHFHVRLKCPDDSPLCVPQEPPPDDGCGTKLAWWFSDDALKTAAKKKQADAEAPEPELPPACAEVLQPSENGAGGAPGHASLP